MFRSFQPKSLCVLIFESLHFIASSWFWKNNLLYRRTVLSILFLKNRFRHFLHTYIFCFLSQILCFFFSHLYRFSIRTSVVLSIFTLLCRTRSLFLGCLGHLFWSRWLSHVFSTWNDLVPIFNIHLLFNIHRRRSLEACVKPFDHGFLGVPCWCLSSDCGKAVRVRNLERAVPSGGERRLGEKWAPGNRPARTRGPYPKTGYFPALADDRETAVWAQCCQIFWSIWESRNSNFYMKFPDLKYWHII